MEAIGGRVDFSGGQVNRCENGLQRLGGAFHNVETKVVKLRKGCQWMIVIVK